MRYTSRTCFGGNSPARTDDLGLVRTLLYQLSYAPAEWLTGEESDLHAWIQNPVPYLLGDQSLCLWSGRGESNSLSKFGGLEPNQ